MFKFQLNGTCLNSTQFALQTDKVYKYCFKKGYKRNRKAYPLTRYSIAPTSQNLTSESRARDDEDGVRGSSDREEHERIEDAHAEDKQSPDVVLDTRLLQGRSLSVGDNHGHHDHVWQRSQRRSMSGPFVGVLTFVCSSSNVFVVRCSLPIRLQ